LNPYAACIKPLRACSRGSSASQTVDISDVPFSLPPGWHLVSPAGLSRQKNVASLLAEVSQNGLAFPARWCLLGEWELIASFHGKHKPPIHLGMPLDLISIGDNRTAFSKLVIPFDMKGVIALASVTVLVAEYFPVASLGASPVVIDGMRFVGIHDSILSDNPLHPQGEVGLCVGPGADHKLSCLHQSFFSREGVDAVSRWWSNHDHSRYCMLVGFGLLGQMRSGVACFLGALCVREIRKFDLVVDEVTTL